MEIEKKRVFIFVLVILLLIINYPFINSFLKDFFAGDEIVVVERVIDGDTIEVEEGIVVRLLGINAPEREEMYYRESKEFLEGLILDKEVKLEFGKEKHDKYNRVLAYIFLGSVNINEEMVRNGFANFYFPEGKDFYYGNFVDAWKECFENNEKLCKKSLHHCSNCINLKEFDWQKEKIVLYNGCDVSCNLESWELGDEGRKRFIFPEFSLRRFNEVSIIVGEGKDSSTNLFWSGEKSVWTKTGDTLFLRDKNGRLIFWKNY